MQAVAPEPRIKHKSFTYHTNLRWIDNHSALLQSPGKPNLHVSSPPEFKGEKGVWTPEDMFVAAVEICTFTTFISFAQRQELPVIRYTSEAEGVLEFADGEYRITKIIIRPTILVETAEAVAGVTETLHSAHAHCLIGNSISSEVILEPKIEIHGRTEN